LATAKKTFEETEGMLLRLAQEKGLLMDKFQAEMVSFLPFSRSDQINFAAVSFTDIQNNFENENRIEVRD